MDYVSAFMPCTPNPTTGFFFYVLRQDVIDLDITVEQAMTVIMSAGIVQPGGDAQSQTKTRRARRNRPRRAGGTQAGADRGEITRSARAQ